MWGTNEYAPERVGFRQSVEAIRTDEKFPIDTLLNRRGLGKKVVGGYNFFSKLKPMTASASQD